jgi:nicotinamide riboside kinase
MKNGCFVIAIVGAESTGKTSLARELAPALAQHTGAPATWVPEVLREWCDERGRTPRADEQAAIAAEQHRRIDAAAATHRIVVADTTALMTAVYSKLLFNDDSLREDALRRHGGSTVTLLTALDLPWVGDGHQRDGPHVRAPVDALVRRWLAEHGIGWSVVGGVGERRLQAALDAAAAALRTRGLAPTNGLFTRLAASEAAAASWTWVCEKCDAPDCEHRVLLAARRSG